MLKYGLGTDPDTGEFLIMDKEKHIIFARGADENLLKEFIDYENGYLDKTQTLQASLDKAQDRIKEFETEIGALKCLHSDSVVAVENHFKAEIQTLEAEIEDYQSDIICRNSDRNELYLKEKKLRETLEASLDKAHNQGLKDLNQIEELVSSLDKAQGRVKELEVWINKMIKGGETTELFASSHKELYQAEGALEAFKAVLVKLLTPPKPEG